LTPWYRHWTAQVGLRVAGLALLLSGWPDIAALRNDAALPTSCFDLALAALLFASVSAGAALTLFGPDLWKPARVSARWTPQPGAFRCPRR
jgi:hypothetical protein